MKRALLRNLSTMARDLLLPHKFISIPKTPLGASIHSSLRFFSSSFDSSNTSKSAPTQNPKPSAMDADDDVSKQELKLRIKKFFDGDESALPAVIEGVLKRKLFGRHEESDDELMKELRGESEDDVGGCSDSDAEFDESVESETDDG